MNARDSEWGQVGRKGLGISLCAQPGAERPPRKEYTPPAVTTYGRLSELTGSEGNEPDDGIFGTNVTS